MLELDAGIRRGKAPVHCDGFGIACLLPGSHLAFDSGLIPNTWLQGLSRPANGSQTRNTLQTPSRSYS